MENKPIEFTLEKALSYYSWMDEPDGNKDSAWEVVYRAAVESAALRDELTNERANSKMLDAVNVALRKEITELQEFQAELVKAGTKTQTIPSNG